MVVGDDGDGEQDLGFQVLANTATWSDADHHALASASTVWGVTEFETMKQRDPATAIERPFALWSFGG